jgi:hypothetical protein
MSDRNQPARNLPPSHPLRAGIRSPFTVACTCGAAKRFEMTPDFAGDLAKAGWTHEAIGDKYLCPTCSTR